MFERILPWRFVFICNVILFIFKDTDFVDDSGNYICSFCINPCLNCWIENNNCTSCLKNYYLKVESNGDGTCLTESQCQNCLL